MIRNNSSIKRLFSKLAKVKREATSSWVTAVTGNSPIFALQASLVRFPCVVRRTVRLVFAVFLP